MIQEWTVSLLLVIQSLLVGWMAWGMSEGKVTEVALFWKALSAQGYFNVAITSLTRFEVALFVKSLSAPGNFDVDSPRSRVGLLKNPENS